MRRCTPEEAAEELFVYLVACFIFVLGAAVFVAFVMFMHWWVGLP